MDNEIIGQVLKSGSGIFFLVFFTIFIIVSGILHYHWANYGIAAGKINTIRWWYFLVSIMLLCIMAIALVYIMA